MIGTAKVIALIPARGGSKGVLRKNLRKICGRPLIDYTLEAAKGADRVDGVYVSSDDDDVLELACRAGVEAISRPAELASDAASAVDVVKDFIGQLCRLGFGPDAYIVYLQPTSPLRKSHHIEEALECLEKSSRHTLISVREMRTSPYKAFRLDGDGTLRSLFEERLSNARRQDLPVSYVPNGAIYVFRVSDFVERGGFPSDGSLPFVMSETDSLDIDSEDDLRKLRLVLERCDG